MELSSPPAAVLLPHVSTSHARLLPIAARTRFEYPLFYVAVDVKRLERTQESVSPWVWGLDWTGSVPPLFGLQTNEYLKVSHKGEQRSSLYDTLAKRLDYWLEQAGIDPSQAGPSYLLTMPSVLGYAFRPLSVHYILRAAGVPPPISEYGEDSGLLCVILEVANTFGDSHIYILDERNRIKTRVGRSLLQLFASMPLTAFLTYPRIVYQAALVHYGFTGGRGKLPVYTRPRPLPRWADVNGKLEIVANADALEGPKSVDGSWVDVGKPLDQFSSQTIDKSSKKAREGLTIVSDSSAGGWYGR
ncbi:hypothetical protein HDU93_009887 [Gonapodya sp. JEL0774]|nr:hypothetical protein HDU93_009887 [Gonapodya sp. JEL0774]